MLICIQIFELQKHISEVGQCRDTPTGFGSVSAEDASARVFPTHQQILAHIELLTAVRFRIRKHYSLLSVHLLTVCMVLCYGCILLSSVIN